LILYSLTNLPYYLVYTKEFTGIVLWQTSLFSGQTVSWPIFKPTYILR